MYNAGVVHDEVSGPDMEVGSYCVGVGGLHMPGLRPNALIPDEAGYVFPTGRYFADLKALFELMFRNLAAGEPHAELFCSSLMHALLVAVLTVTEGARGAQEIPADAPHILGRRIQDYIDRHYMEPITLQSMGEAMHISPYYLSHVFKQMSGYSPVQYLLRRRIGEHRPCSSRPSSRSRASRRWSAMIRQSYFNLQFTKNVGMPPNKYRHNYIVSVGEEEKPRRRKRIREDCRAVKQAAAAVFCVATNREKFEQEIYTFSLRRDDDIITIYLRLLTQRREIRGFFR